LNLPDVFIAIIRINDGIYQDIIEYKKSGIIATHVYFCVHAFAFIWIDFNITNIAEFTPRHVET
jgi:hypothetical protein